jgi:major intracellular serine protease
MLIKLADYKVEIDSLDNPGDLTFLDYTGRQSYYKQGYYGQDVIVAVVDTGIAWDHKELKDAYIDGKSFVSGNDSYYEDNSHGSHVSGTIAGKNVGIAPQAKILTVKVMDDKGIGNIERTIEGLKYILNWKGKKGEKVDIANMSLGASSELEKYPDLLNKYHQAIKDLVNNNIIVIVAAGNTGKKEHQYPAFFDEVVTVAACDVKNKIANFSTRSDAVDICQNGVDIVSVNYKGGYMSMSGTSMATPMVSGMAALIVCKYKSLFKKSMPELALYEMLKMNTIDIGIKGTDDESGAGFCTLKSFSNILMTIGDNKMYVDGNVINLDTPPQIINNRTMVPVRVPFEAAGGKVTWDEQNNIVKIIL